ncbi:phytanoyl-CoA dioxygenase family protein [Kitasatospora sp. GP30]|uniref:phytanoyl-CoA dioxygenase family protein n=1 Tax=Kitasatospora sp. GP30 TaxID=3035084 RepID=UPI000C6FEAEA|nr:phytanoyl-CoA dioxygenase family protein [Kitasatospora sp. GP30]
MTNSTLSASAADPAALRDRYDRDGVVQVDAVLPVAETDVIRSAFMTQVEADRCAVGAVEEVAQDAVLARYPRFMNPHRRPDLEIGRLARTLMTDPRLLGLVTALVGPAYGAQSMFYFKPPSARGQALHQDNFFLRAHPETCIAAWIAVDACDAANGALRVVPGSHTMEIVCPEEADPGQSFTSGLVRAPAGLPVVQSEMRPGDVLFFHGSAVHGSLPNTTTDRFRRSLIFHYVPQSSTEIAGWYLPLVDPNGSDVDLAEATGGGPCGDTWTGAAH